MDDTALPYLEGIDCLVDNNEESLYLNVWAADANRSLGIDCEWECECECCRSICEPGQRHKYILVFRDTKENIR